MCERCEELQEEIRQLRETLAPSDELLTVPESWRLTPVQKRIFVALKDGSLFTKERVILVSRRPQLKSEWDVDRKMADVFICLLRRKLKAAQAPWRIVTVWGEGYKMEPLEG